MQIAPLSSSPDDGHPSIVAKRLEQAFLEEMLKYCGPASMSGDFSGGYAEDHFTSFLTQEYATILSRRVDFGFEQLLTDRTS